MKKIIFLFLIVLNSAFVFCQEFENSNTDITIKLETPVFGKSISFFTPYYDFSSYQKISAQTMKKTLATYPQSESYLKRSNNSLITAGCFALLALGGSIAATALYKENKDLSLGLIGASLGCCGAGSISLIFYDYNLGKSVDIWNKNVLDIQNP